MFPDVFKHGTSVPLWKALHLRCFQHIPSHAAAARLPSLSAPPEAFLLPLHIRE